MDLMWELSPAQVTFTFRALGHTKKRGSAKDLAMFAAKARGQVEGTEVVAD